MARKYIREDSEIPSKVIVSWKNLNVYSSKQPSFLGELACFGREKKILQDVSGIAKPGELIALMGSSGSGKTTLLNTITHRTSLDVNGDIYINGIKSDAKKMSMVSCFVQQQDIFFHKLTVNEHLTFQVWLRMDALMKRKDKREKVEEFLKKFHLEGCKHTKIGNPEETGGISGGQRRRLSLASEMLTNPAVLFCDEPTSGLDSVMAKGIVEILLKYAHEEKKTVICTIHQPAKKVFEMFDSVCLLAKEGKLAYFGTIKESKRFFSQITNEPFPEDENPADYYLEVLGVDPEKEVEDKRRVHGYCDSFKKHANFKNMLQDIEASIEQAQGFNVDKNYSPYKAKWIAQYGFCLQRCFRNYFRQPKVVAIDLIMSIMTAVLGGLIYLDSSDKIDGICTFDQNTATNISTALFYAVTVMCIISVMSAVLAFPLEIPIFLRENLSCVYRTSAYYLAKFTFEVPIQILIPAINATIIYYMVQFGCGNKNYTFFMFVIILVANASYSLGHVLSIVGKKVNVAISLAAPTVAIMMLFSGFFLKKSDTTPIFLTYVKFASVFNYGFDLLMINQWEYVGNITCISPYPELLCIKDGAEILDANKIRPKNKWFYVSMLFVLIAIFRLLAFCILRIKTSRQNLWTSITLLCRKKPKEKPVEKNINLEKF